MGLKESVAVWNCEVDEETHFHIWQLAAVSYSVTFNSTTCVVILNLYNGWLQGVYAFINIKLPSAGGL
jgi:hypothetical protein